MKLVIDNSAAPSRVEPVAKKKPAKQRRFCRHGGTMTIDEETRLVHCPLCDSWLDAFTALEVLTRRWQQQVDATEWAQYSYKQLRDQVAKLKREERNTKARIRNAKRKLCELKGGNDSGD